MNPVPDPGRTARTGGNLKGTKCDSYNNAVREVDDDSCDPSPCAGHRAWCASDPVTILGILGAITGLQPGAICGSRGRLRSAAQTVFSDTEVPPWTKYLLWEGLSRLGVSHAGFNDCGVATEWRDEVLNGGYTRRRVASALTELSHTPVATTGSAQQACTRCGPTCAAYLPDPEGAELVQEEMQRRRFRPPPLSGWKLSMRWRQGLGMYLRHVPARIARALRAVFLSCGCPSWVNPGPFIALAKYLGELAKKAPSALDFIPGCENLREGDWVYFVDLNTLGGYRHSAPPAETVEEVKAWVTSNPDHTFFRSRDWFLSGFSRGVAAFMQLGQPPAHHHMPTLDEYLRDLDWGGGGSSTGARLYVSDPAKGRATRARKGKMATAFAVSPRDIRESVLSRDVLDVNTAIQKREAKKVRPVINASLEAFIASDYIGSLFDRSFSACLDSTLFMSAPDAAAMWQASIAEVRKKRLWFLPLDQSSFDHQMNVEMRSIILSEWRRWFEIHAPPHTRTDVLLCLQRVADGYENGRVDVAGESVPAISGVLSGWKFTAFIDTLINYAELFAVREMCKELLGSDPIRHLVVQGDDDKVAVPRARDGVTIVALYNEAALPVNPAKFFLSQDRDEFLRRVVHPDGVRGYPARSVLSLMWRNPIQTEPPKGLLRGRAIIDSWNGFITRGGAHGPCVHSMITDLSRALDCPTDWARDWAYTPASLGGGGLWSPEAAVAGKRYWGLTASEGHIERLDKIVGRPDGLKNLLAHVAMLPGVPAASVRFVERMAIYRVQNPRSGNIVVTKGIFRPISWVIPTVARLRMSQWRPPEPPDGFGSIATPIAIPPTSWEPAARDDLPANFSGDILTGCYREEGPGPGYRSLLAPASAAVYDRFVRTATRRVLDAWVGGSLRPSFPAVPGWAAGALSGIYASPLAAFWTKFVSGGYRVTMGFRDSWALAFEAWVYETAHATALCGWAVGE